MPSRCCVTNCRSNYDGEQKVSVFKFPNDEELRKKWIRAIPRKGFVPTKSSRVCEMHFGEEDIRRTSECYNPDIGTKIIAPLLQPRLRPGAVPSIFLNCPKYLTREVQSRENPDAKWERLESEQLQKAVRESIRSEEEYNNKYRFTTTEKLVMCLKNITLPKGWDAVIREENVYFLFLDMIPCPNVQMSVQIDNKLNVIVFANSCKVDNVEFGIPCKMHDVNELCMILEKLTTLVNSTLDSRCFDFHVDLVSSSLSYLLEICQTDDTKKIISFVSEQLKLLRNSKNTRTYSHELLILSCLIKSISPHAYKFLRGTGYVILPHPCTLDRMCSSFNANPAIEQSEHNFLSYMKQKVTLLTAEDKYVALLVDEIHIKPFVSYKGGSVLGLAFNAEEAATSAHVFMVQSAKTTYKDVVHILPVKTLTAPSLHLFIKKIIIGLENIGLKVFCIISDNNSINRKAMMQFEQPEKLSIVYRHPLDPTRPLFYLIDSVHLLKCIRNNWLNQKDRKMHFPPFPSVNVQGKSLEVASMAVLYKLLEIEDSLVKYAYGLTLKSLNPSNLERQNVRLVLQIFNDFVPQGLRQVGKRHNLMDHEGTATWIDIILTWFKIMNVRTPLKGKHKNDIYQEPLTASADDIRVKFLHNFHDWLITWESMHLNTGKLSRETHMALKHTTHATIEIARYCVEELSFDYILTGRFQTDALEDRFGKYRQLAGSNYNVCLTEVFETETKLRLQSLVNTLNSDEILSDFPSEFKSCNEQVEVLEQLISDGSLDIARADTIMPVLTYIAGYCCHVVLKKLNNCSYCRNVILTEALLEISEQYSFLKSIDRGHLKYPSDVSVTIVMLNYLIVEHIISKHCNYFLKLENQREVLVELTYRMLYLKEVFLEVDCVENHEGETITKCIIWSCTNIMLNNFCKSKNEEILKKKKENCHLKNRKLQTLQK